MHATPVDPDVAPFALLAALPEPPLAELALAIAAALRDGSGDGAGVLRTLDELADEVRPHLEAAEGVPVRESYALALVLGRQHGFAGDRDDYDAPDNSFLDRVIERRRGLPILLSVLWLAIAERVQVDLAGVGLPGHFVVAHVGASPPLLLDPFRGGVAYTGASPAVLPLASAHDIALRILTNLVASYERRVDPGRALRAARMRLLLPADARLRDRLELDARRLAARFN